MLEGAPPGNSIILLGDFSALEGIDRETCHCHSLSITNTTFEHKAVYKSMWQQDTLGRSLMINFVSVSSDLQLYALDTWVKKGAELSTNHHMASWINWQGRILDRPGVHNV